MSEIDDKYETLRSMGIKAVMTCYYCKEPLTPRFPCQNPDCKVSHLSDLKSPLLEESYAKPGRSETTIGESGSDSVRQRIEEDRCPDCRRRSGDGQIHIRNSEGSDGITMAYVRGIGFVSVAGIMSIRGERLAVTPEPSHTLTGHTGR